MAARAPLPAPSNFEFDALAAAANYRAAIVGEFRACLRGAVLEVGAGIGQISALLAAESQADFLVSIEPDADFCGILHRRSPHLRVVRGTIAAISPESAWDAVLSVNVLEHIGDDEQELRHYHSLLAARSGCLCLFVPARSELYSPIDRDFGHHRRYSRPGLRRKLEGAGFRVCQLRYFNFAGYVAWWVNFRLLKRRRFQSAAVEFFDRVIFPLVHGWETRVAPPPVGQSLLAIARASPESGSNP